MLMSTCQVNLRLAKQDHLVLLDERGKALSSTGMAELVAEVFQIAIGCLDEAKRADTPTSQ